MLPTEADPTPDEGTFRSESGRRRFDIRVARPSPRSLSTVALAAAITVLAWPFLDGPARQGLDRSWQIGLHLATWMDLRYGVDLVFTYGPLGFLSIPEPFLGWTSALALLATLAVYFGIAAILLAEARRIVPLWAAALVTLLVARSFAGLAPYEAFQAITFIVCVEALAGRVRLPTMVIAVAFGVAAGVAILGKLNVGVFVAAMAGATILALDSRRWRGIAVMAAVAVATALTLWVVAGQRVGDLGAYAAGSIQIISGYSDAMGLDIDPAFLWIYLALAGTAILVTWTGFRMSVGWPIDRRVGLLLVGAAFGFAMWKTASAQVFPAAKVFASVLVSLAVVGALLGDRRQWLTSLLVVGVAFAATSKITPRSYVDVVASARSVAVELAHAVLPDGARRAEERNRASLRAQYLLDPTTFAELTGRRVAIDPVEIGVAFAYPEFTWAPLPVIQSYSAYTEMLDHLNAGRLATADGPDRILRRAMFERDPPDWLIRQRGRPVVAGENVPVVFGGRFVWFEAPAAMLETFCRYRQLSAVGSWQVLGRSGGSCGPAEPLETITAREGTSVPVPVETRPGRLVIVRVLGLEPSLLDRVRTALFKAEEWDVTIDGVRYRLVESTAADGLLLAVPPAADGTGDFAFGPPIASLSIASRELPRNRTLTYVFESVALIDP